MSDAAQRLERAAVDAELRRRFLIPALGVLAFAFVSATIAVFWAAARQDELAAQQTRAVVASLMQQQVSDIERMALDYSWWDTAVDKLVDEPDPTWADDNIGWYLDDLANMAFSLVLSPTDSLTYSAVDGARRTTSPLGLTLAPLAQGLSDVRSFDPAAPRGRAGFVRLGADIFVVGLGAITPEKADDPRLGRPRSVLALGRRIDAGLLRDLERNFGVSGLTFSAGSATETHTRLALKGFDGSDVATLSWRPPTPGTDWIRVALPGLIVLIAVVAGMALQVFRVWREALDRLFAKEMLLRTARDQAEAADRAKSVFLANVSHELRTPLNAIIGFSSIMSDQMLGPVGSSKYHGYAKDILGTSRHLMAIINEILDLSNIESARHGLDISSFPAADAMAEALRLTRAEFPDVRFELARSEPDGSLLRADRGKIVQILTNLLANAAKASGSGGQVDIEQGALDGGFRFAISDAGPRIDDSTARVLFTPFARGVNPYHVSASGYGIGLAVSKRLAELHGATLTLSANADRPGSTATMILPEARVIAAVAADTAASA